MKNYYDVNEGMSKYFEKIKNAQTIATAIDRNLINDATLLRIGLDAMYECGLFKKALDEWEELNKTDQTWEKFQTHFIAAKEKFNLKKGIHDKKGSIRQANAAEDEHTQESTDQAITNAAFDVSQMDSYLKNLAAAATSEKNVLDKLVKKQ